MGRSGARHATAGPHLPRPGSRPSFRTTLSRPRFPRAKHKTGAALKALLTANSVETSAKYNTRQNTLAKSIAEEMCRAKSTKDGITVLQFVGTNNLEGTLRVPRSTAGRSARTARRTGRKADSCCARPAHQTAQTPAHEIGHLLFLPHAPSLNSDGTKRTDNIGQVPDFHDGANWNCIMSYTRPRPGFCGLCLIRLRGWKGDQFDKNGPKTTK